MEENKSWSLGFEFLDIEIIDHKKEKNTEEKWACDQCRLFFLSKDKLIEHKKKHERSLDETVNCKYCNKILSNTEDTKECYSNKKCETCEYRCSKCPKRFLRHSSLLNHEKNHLLMKKRKNKCNERLINRINKTKTTKALKRGRPKKIATEEFSKGFKNKQPSEERCPKKKRIKSEEPLGKKVKRSVKSFGVLQKEKNSSRKSRQNTSIINTVEPLDKTLTNNENISKRSLTKSNTLHKDPETPGTSKQIPKTSNTVSNTPLGVSSSENVVNYKPFSCHVCGETFASDNALLQHIRSHGENAVSNFRCKHCGDEFDDIYKMQYHLAICPLAEDDLESTLKQSIPRRFTTPNLPSGIRKRGRPKKTPSSDLKSETPCSEIKSEITSDSEEYNKSLCIRGGLRKRKHEQTGEHSKKMLKNTPVSKQIANIKSSISKNESDDNNVESDSYDNGPMNDDCSDSANPIDDSFETSDDERRKLHACPFPNCGIKFTREKALLCHMRNHTDDFDDSLKCHICDIPFEDVQSLRSHINICKGIKEEKDDDFDEQNYAEKNEYVDKPNHTFQQSKGYFICKVCGRTYLTEEKLKRHEALHRSSKFLCRICNDVFNSQPLLDEHFTAKHPSKSSYHCNVCNEDFISELFLQIHTADYHEEEVSLGSGKTDSEPKEKPKSRSRCMKTLKKHSYSSTVAINRFTNRNTNSCWCPVCFQNFTEKGSLRLHFRSVHVLETSSLYICDVCEVKKPSAEMLCYHLEVHSTNLLSVNRFSKLRECVNNTNALGTADSYIKGNMIEIEPGTIIERGKETNPTHVIRNKTKSKLLKTRSKNLNTNKSKQKNVSDLKSDCGSSTTEVVRDLGNRRKKHGLKSVKGRNIKKNSRGISSNKIYSTCNLNTSLLSSNKNLGNTKSINRIATITATSTRLSGKRIKTQNLKKIQVINKKPIRNVKRIKITDPVEKYVKIEPPIPNYHDETKESAGSILGISLGSLDSRMSKKHTVVAKTSKHKNHSDQKLDVEIDPDTPTVIADLNQKSSYKDTGNVTDSECLHTNHRGTDPIDENNSKFSSSDEEATEEICCSMCSVSFYTQDELLDHVATHI